MLLMGAEPKRQTTLLAESERAESKVNFSVNVGRKKEIG